ncbi:MAG: hypothetical protein H6747_13915 [Deltaproteobacteria bacterium]|nr:hypothetical protein [Deltaproteobacteria bacterium]
MFSGRDIRARRHELGLDIATTARAAGVSENVWNAIERDGLQTLGEAADVARALALDLDEVLRDAPTASSAQRVARFRDADCGGRLSGSDVRKVEVAVRLARVGEALWQGLGRGESWIRRERTVAALHRRIPAWKHGYALGIAARRRAPHRQQSPIANVEQLLVDMGIHVARLNFDGDFDALSVVEPDALPLVLLNTRKARVRQHLARRATLAHELCHLLHDGGVVDLMASVSYSALDTDIESRARGFAPSFLAPGPFVRLEAEAPSARVAELARTWGLSGDAARWHAKNLQLLSARQAEALEPPTIASAGWEEATAEPPWTRAGVAPSPLASGLVAGLAVEAWQRDQISRGRLDEIVATA